VLFACTRDGKTYALLSKVNENVRSELARVGVSERQVLAGELRELALAAQFSPDGGTLAFTFAGEQHGAALW